MTTRLCSECRKPLNAAASPRQIYCQKRCRDRAAQRRRRSGTESESELSRLKRHLGEANARIRLLETRLGERTGQRAAMKKKRHAERLRYRRVQRDLDRATATAQDELKSVQLKLSAREQQQAVASISNADAAELHKLRRENAAHREDLDHAQRVTAQLRRDMVEERHLTVSLTDEVEQYQQIAQRMRIKSDALATVFIHWNELAGALYAETQHRDATELEADMVKFWVWLNTHYSHLFPNGYIETSLEDELAEEAQ